MTLYLDTSLLVAALSAETATARVQDWLRRQGGDDLAISDWVVAEFSSAMAIKLRAGHIEPPHRAAILSQFNRWIVESLDVLPVERAHFRAASRFVDQFALGLRAGDALHLAVAADRGAIVATLDRKLASAGAVLGVATVLA